PERAPTTTPSDASGNRAECEWTAPGVHSILQLMPLAAIARAPGAPLSGSLLGSFRDPLGFFRSTARLGSVVDLHFPGSRSFQLSDPADIEDVAVTANKSLVKDGTLRDLRRVVGQGLLTSEGEFWRRQRRLAQPAFHRDRLRA